MKLFFQLLFFLFTLFHTNISEAKFNVSNITYNGNITGLQRNGYNGSGFGQIDNLYYNYTNNSTSNRLNGVGTVAKAPVNSANQLTKASSSAVGLLGDAAKGGGNVLRHYTNEAGYKAIMESGELLPSLGVKNARYGSGQYLTDLMSEGLTSGQVSRRLFGVPWNGSKVTHFIDINVGGLNTIKNAPYNYLVPGTNSLPLGGRIVNHGVSIFK